ncbi:MAG: stage II sporulation protein M, partial [Ferruginibacter sp.]
ILFPGTYTRLQSFKRAAKDAAKVLISLVPFFIMAAFLESYITNLMSRTYEKGATGMPVWLSILILIASFSFIIWYYVIHPIRLHKKGFYIKNNGIISRLHLHNA